MEPYIQRIFDRIEQLHDSVGLHGNRFAFDSMHLPCARTDPDGVWMWEPASEEWVYGYGLLVAVDCASDLPAGAVVVQRKQRPETADARSIRASRREHGRHDGSRRFSV